MQKKLQQFDYSHILVVAHDQQHMKDLNITLTHYFSDKSQNQQLNQIKSDFIFVTNKYYQAKVKLNFISWNQVLHYNIIQQNDNKQNLKESAQKILSNIKKIDLLIMLIKQNNQPTMLLYQHFDNIIQSYNPEQFMILVDTITPSIQWQHQQIIIQKCNNFIEIVKQDLNKININKPQWTHGLLKYKNQQEQNQEDQQLGIFSLLDRIQTTRWSKVMEGISNQSKSNKEDNKQNPEKANQIKKNIMQFQILPINHGLNHINIEQNISGQQLLQAKINKQQKDQQQNSTILNNQCQQQANQQEIQSQMLAFQSLMGEMLSFKNQAQNMKDDQRKNKAEQMFSKIFKGII